MKKKENKLKKTPNEPRNGEECRDCGERKADVHSRQCPFAADVHGEIRYVTICDDCCHQRAMDI